jgi:hypothetical protein
LAIAESESSNALIDLDPPQAVTLAESGLAHWDAQLKAAPATSFTIPRRARAAVRLARALLRVGRTQPAIAAAREAVETFRTLLAQQPTRSTTRIRGVRVSTGGPDFGRGPP